MLNEKKSCCFESAPPLKKREYCFVLLEVYLKNEKF